MNTIYKYEVKPKATGEKFTIDMPSQSKVLCFREQNDKLYIWAEVDTDEDSNGMYFVMYGTGQEVTVTSNRMDYVGTVQQGAFVWHLYTL